MPQVRRQAPLRRTARRRRAPSRCLGRPVTILRLNKRFARKEPYEHAESPPDRRRAVKAVSREAGARNAPALRARLPVRHLNGKRVSAALKSESPATPESPVDAAGHGDPGDLSAEALLKDRLPGDETKAQSVVDHGELAATEIDGADQRSGDVVSGFRRFERQAARLGHLRADAGDFLLLQSRQEVPGRADAALGRPGREALIDEAVGSVAVRG